MSAIVKKKISDSYMKLIRRYPLRPIRSEVDFDRATDIAEKLAIRGEDDLDPGEHDYLDALVEFIALYGARHFPAPPDRRTPLQRLKYLVEQSHTTPAALQRILGCSQSLVSMILGGKRELSKDNIKSLAAYFKLDAGYFF